MFTGVSLVNAGEALVLRSRAILLWARVFFHGNVLYMPPVEEPALLDRFGDDNAAYLAAVPRWFPWRRAWAPAV